MKVSYLITTFQRCGALEKHLEQLEKQTVKPDQVMVCDDGSTDQSKMFFNAFKEQNNDIVCEYYNTEKTDTFNAAESRNNGIRNAKYELLIMTDVDCLPHKKLIEMYIKNAKNEQIIQIGYRSSQEKYLNCELPCEVEDGKMKLYEKASEESHYLPAGMFTSGNCCMFTKTAQTEAKDGSIGYDERFTGYGYEDSEYGLRLAKNGCQFIWNKDAIIYHMNPSSTYQIDPRRKEKERLNNRDLLNKIINE